MDLFREDSFPDRNDIVMTIGKYYGYRLSLVKKKDLHYFNSLYALRKLIHDERLRVSLEKLHSVV